MVSIRGRFWSTFALVLGVVLLLAGLSAPAEAATARSLSLAATPTTVTTASVVTFSGRLTKSPKGSTVKIQRKSGTSWVAARSTTTTTTTGRYAVKVTMPTTGAVYSFRALAPKTSRLATAISQTVKITVLRRTAATLKATPSIVEATDPLTPVRFTGTVKPFVAGTVAFIQRFNGAGWTVVTTATISRTGTFSRSFSPPATTSYRLVVPRTGLNAAAVSPTTKVTVSNGPIPPQITTTSLASGIVGTAYSKTLQLNQVPVPKPGTWAVTSGSLPPGLSVSSGSGVLSGTPTTAGSYTFTVTYSETSTALFDSQALTLKIYRQPTVATSALPDAVKGSAYGQQLAVSGGSGSGTWTVTGGSLPAGFTLSSDGLVSGTPSFVGTSSFTVRYTDAVAGLNTPSKTLSIATYDSPVVTTASLPYGIKGQAYSQQLTTSGGSGSGSWDLASGALPAGLTVSSGGLVSGTPTADADASFTVRFTDAKTVLSPVTKALSLRVYAQPTISTSSLPSAVRDAAYSKQLVVAGGSGSGTWTVDGGTLPVGLTLSSGGLLSGTPTETANVSVTFRFTDAVSGLASPTRALQVKVFDDPSITTSTLPYGIKTQAYSQQLVVAGGSGTGTWSVASGTLPAGLTLSSAGLIAGTPSAEANSSFTVQYDDADPALALATQALSLRVYAQPTITTTSLPDGLTGAGYNAQLVVAGGSGAGTWTIDAGTLPGGLAMSPAGTFTGTPDPGVSGTFALTVRFTDSVGGLASPTKALSIKVYTRPTITTPGLPDVRTNDTYSQQLTFSGGSGTGTWSVTSGTLPTGITLSSAGKLTGTATVNGDFSFTVRFADSVTGASTSKALSIHVGPVAIYTVTVPDGTVGASYSTQLSGGPSTLLGGGWSLTAGSLPPGLSFSSNGAITGIPTLAGDYTFSVTYTVIFTGSSTRQYTLHVNP